MSKFGITVTIEGSQGFYIDQVAVEKALRQCGVITRSSLQQRFYRLSNGGGAWPALAPSTAAKRKGKKILIDKGYLVAALNPVLNTSGGAYEQIFPAYNNPSIDIGFNETYTTPGSHVSIGSIAFFHQYGGPHLPVRKILVAPDDAATKLCAKVFDNGDILKAKAPVKTTPLHPVEAVQMHAAETMKDTANPSDAEVSAGARMARQRKNPESKDPHKNPYLAYRAGTIWKTSVYRPSSRIYQGGTGNSKRKRAATAAGIVDPNNLVPIKPHGITIPAKKWYHRKGSSDIFPLHTGADANVITHGLKPPRGLKASQRNTAKTTAAKGRLSRTKKAAAIKRRKKIVSALKAVAKTTINDIRSRRRKKKP